MKKFIFTLIFIICLTSMASLAAFAHTKPENISISDFSGVLSDTVKDYIKSKNDILFEKTEAKIIFVTTESTEGMSVDDYAKKLYDDWDIGYIGRKNSIFVVIDTHKDDYSFVCGKNIRYAFPESEIYKYFVDFFEPHYDNGSHDRAVMSLYNAFGRWYESHYNDLSLGLDENISYYIYGMKEKDTEIIESKIWIWVALVVCVVLLIAGLKMKRDYELRMRKNERRKQKRKHQLDIDKITKS
ncbi:MAG: TPM domain-containing protein [Ruminococcaceae bacterium]|nr:TPM domain-containing protein [Oscillospiraceae bacterium]